MGEEKERVGERTTRVEEVNRTKTIVTRKHRESGGNETESGTREAQQRDAIVALATATAVIPKFHNSPWHR